MSRGNKKLAQNMVEQLAKFERTEGGYIVVIPEIAYRATHVKTTKEKQVDTYPDGGKVKNSDTVILDKAVTTTKQDAADLAAKDIASQLDDGSIVLSDTWAKDNLK